MRLVPFLCVLPFALALSSPAQTIQISPDNKTIAITASDSAELLADRAEVSIGFTSYGTEQNATYSAASKTSNDILQALLSAGIPRDAIRSDSQRLTTIDNDDKLRFDKGLRFTFTQSWKVNCKASDAADVLHLAITAGANNSGNIEWRLADDNALEAAAAEKALTHARQIAEKMAAGLHTQLGSLLYASNQAPRTGIYALLETSSASLSMSKANLKPLAIVPDKVSRSATVYAVFAIAKP